MSDRDPDEALEESDTQPLDLEGEDAHLVNIVLDERNVVRRAPEVEQERAIAVYDLLEENRFRPHGGHEGPYTLHLRIEENRLMFDVRTSDDIPLHIVTLPLSPFRRVIRDYFQICESYYDAIKRLSPSQIEAIDMGRRGLHNDGSQLLKERLSGRIEVDFQTARRLFTLLCIMQIRG